MGKTPILDKGAKILGICAIAYGSVACLVTLVGTVLRGESNTYLYAWFLPVVLLVSLWVALAMTSEGLKNRKTKSESSPPKMESEGEKP